MLYKDFINDTTYPQVVYLTPTSLLNILYPDRGATHKTPRISYSMEYIQIRNWKQATVRVALKRDDRVRGGGVKYLNDRILRTQDEKERDELIHIKKTYYGI